MQDLAEGSLDFIAHIGDQAYNYQVRMATSRA